MKGALSGTGFFLITTLACGYFASCHFRNDYTAEIKRIDSLSLLADSSILMMNGVVESSHNSDSALKCLRYIHDNYKGVMPRAMARTLDSYGMMRQDMLEIGEFSQTLRNQLDTARKQVLDLRQALNEGATHDHKDNKMTEDYVKYAMKMEESRLNNLLGSAKQGVEKSSNVQALYYQMTPQVRIWMDSIRQKSEK